MLLHSLHIDPAVLNSSSPWASDIKQLEELYNSPSTGAVTTRTATLSGFQEDESHTVAFHSQSPTSLNTYGYSPHSLKQYLEWTKPLLSAGSKKPIIISITASSAEELSEMVSMIQGLRVDLQDSSPGEMPSRIGIELNSSCPNIRGHPPPSYAISSGAFSRMLDVLSDAARRDPSLTVGVKLPPYVHEGIFQDVLVELEKQNMHFLTCINTLGGCILFEDQVKSSNAVPPNAVPPNAVPPFAVPGEWGGMAGEFLHPLALGNVHRFRTLLNASPNPSLQKIKIIGVGGVRDKESAVRMYEAGADAVALATALGIEGVGVFDKLGRN